MNLARLQVWSPGYNAENIIHEKLRDVGLKTTAQ